MQKLRSSVKFAESDLRMRPLHQPLGRFRAARYTSAARPVGTRNLSTVVTLAWMAAVIGALLGPGRSSRRNCRWVCPRVCLSPRVSG